MKARSLLACAVMLAAACGNPPEAPLDVLAVVAGVGRDPEQNLVLLLQDESGDRVLPIWIGLPEAQSIAAELEDVDLARPNTHDLARDLLTQLGGTLERVVVTELRGSTYFAVLVLERNGELVEVDSRPSDAVAIALRARAPIYVRDGLFSMTARDALLEDDSPRVGL